jgi:hypothetical protein
VNRQRSRFFYKLRHRDLSGIIPVVEKGPDSLLLMQITTGVDSRVDTESLVLQH